MLSTNARNGVLGTACQYLDAGMSVIPVRLDGSKRPAVPWKEYQSRHPSADEILDWFDSQAGIGLVTGLVSGGFEVLDFDEPAIYPAWRSLIPDSIADDLPVIRTGSGGVQVYYRSAEVTGNHKIAMDPYVHLAVDDGGRHRHETGSRVRIETRGEGGYVVAPGSPPAVHRSGRPYVQESGVPLPQIPVITSDDRRQLWEVARRFDCRPVAQDACLDFVRKRVAEIRSLSHNYSQADGLTPWDWFNQSSTWGDVLSPAGWTSCDGVYWTRPGKSFGHSAVVRRTDDGNEVLVVFSASAGPLAPRGCDEHKTFNKFQAWREIVHGGDAKAAARAAKEMMR